MKKYKCTKIDKLIITNLPSFYKINLYNEIAKKRKIFVIYTGDSVNERNRDFFQGKMIYPSILLSKNKWLRLLQTIKIIARYNYKEFIIGGWDSFPMWLSAFCSSKKRNSLVVESSYLESITNGIKGIAKKIFLTRICKVYASGIYKKKITDNLGFKGLTIITKGVGVFNIVSQPKYEPRIQVKNYLYVGRLVPCKNLEFLIKVFNDLPYLNLFIAGFGVQEHELKQIAKENTHFLGAINNSELPALYQKMDVFILPSISEPWGLVIEEALNNGLPVIVSNHVGCAEEIVREYENGLIFKYNSQKDLLDKIKQISNIDLYNDMRKNISKMDFSEIEKRQVECYLM